ncbi:hypothetical protein B0T19DRAFT_163994 [Cercophora scortea]|uniref:J domain-containing protein n=1 Tax=Cercophora scortea TaxID=314031 RepID=A0AAE0IM56_9PEZI|nr:hypothetical protein B0T19DRAFT_163994 [Cercophora scortea]
MNSLPPDPWLTLGVDKSADKSEIRTAYKKLVLKCHPDKVQDPELKTEKQNEFQKVQQAYELLNDDAERAKYEQEIKILELRKQAALLKNMPNSSATRSPTARQYATYDIRTAEPPRHKSSGSSGKVYAHVGAHTRSQEEMPSRPYHVYEDGEKHVRRPASYEKPSKRDDDARREKEERRRRRDEEDRLREREARELREAREREKERELRDREQRELREREKERELRRADKKRQERERIERDRLAKDRDRERQRDSEDKARRQRSPYIEENVGDDYDAYASSKPDKKRSSSKRHTETRERERERSTSRRTQSPHVVETVVPPAPQEKATEFLNYAADYITRSRGSAPPPQFSRSQTAHEFITPPVAPTPPPADPLLEEESLRRSVGRAVRERRSSHDTPKSKEKLPLHQNLARGYDEYNIVDASPTSGSKTRMIPIHTKVSASPMQTTSSPPRMSRSSTMPQEVFTASHQPPSFVRTQTWGGHSESRHNDYYEDSDDDQGRQRHRRSRRRSSERGEASHHRYKIDGTKTTKLETPYASYGGESPRYIATDGLESRSPSNLYSSSFKVRETPAYSNDDVVYSNVPINYVPSEKYNQVYA